ncbi:MAG: PBP1A family penicillin-binding protein [Patescibacteria group bacterium]|nr:PBP1A family penicillin-binding protein [Patescibacteria group bacterium]
MQPIEKYLKKIARGLKKFIKKHSFKHWMMFIFGVGIVLLGIIMLWVSSLEIPDFKSFNENKIQSSTKIYDRTGNILLYDVHQDIKRTVIPYEDMGVNIKNATVAIEDSSFYQHNGIRISSIIRATIWAKLTGKKVQGGSTITQQLIKNTLLNQNRTITRKIKEWILALKLEKIMSKEQILALYLNEAPYGGNIYGVEEASKAFFGKEPIDMTLAESAYLAAIPNAPTHYSPYGKYKKDLDARKNLVLKRMLDLKFITQADYDKAINEKVTFLPAQPMHIAAPHFVFYIKDYLEKKYGPNILDDGGLKVITTLDYNLQMKAEQIALERAKENEKSSNGKNTAIVVIDPKTGQILAMVGSRDYFDKSVDGNFNVATAARQPGSSFKPIVYALAFKDGYTENTNLFDVKTEFNASCGPTGKPLPGHSTTNCYSPSDFDNNFRGPMTLKDALAQSVNIVAVKLLYLVGVDNAIKMAHDLGISTLNDPTRYGLSLVIGGGETTLLDMTSVYSVFANKGVRNPPQGILSVEDSSGNMLEQYTDKSYQVLDPNVTRMISDSLSDNKARTPTFGPNSVLVIPGRDVAVKTGTTNDDKDAWTIGYTPSVAVGVWVGNNDNTPMKRGGSSLAGPIWHDVMSEALKTLPVETFDKPDPIDPSLPPILRGFWQGGKTFTIDAVSGGLATEYTPDNTKKEISITNVHSILYWIDKNNILGPEPVSPQKDPQYPNWEYSVQKWWDSHKTDYKVVTEANVPQSNDNVHTTLSKPSFQINGLDQTSYNKDQLISLSIEPTNQDQIKKVDVYVNNTYLISLKSYPYNVSFTPSQINSIKKENIVRVIGYDVNGNSGETTVPFTVDGY